VLFNKDLKDKTLCGTFSTFYF